MSDSGPSGGGVSVEVDAQDPIAINDDNFIDDEESDQVWHADRIDRFALPNHFVIWNGYGYGVYLYVGLNFIQDFVADVLNSAYDLFNSV
jgi:hypothetical protein